MTKKAYELCSKLEKDSIRIDTDTQDVRLDDSTEITKQTYLRINGTREGYRWFAQLLMEMADQVDSGSAASVIVSPRDLDAVVLAGWDSMELSCGNSPCGAIE